MNHKTFPERRKHCLQRCEGELYWHGTRTSAPAAASRCIYCMMVPLPETSFPPLNWPGARTNAISDDPPESRTIGPRPATVVVNHWHILFISSVSLPSQSQTTSLNIEDGAAHIMYVQPLRSVHLRKKKGRAGGQADGREKTTTTIALANHWPIKQRQQAVSCRPLIMCLPCYARAAVRGELMTNDGTTLPVPLLVVFVSISQPFHRWSVERHG